MSEHGGRRDSKDGLVRRRVNEHGVKNGSPKTPQHRRSLNIYDLEYKQLDDADRIFPSRRHLAQDTEEAKKIKKRETRFIILNDSLYKRGFSMPYLKCVDEDEGKYILEEIQEGVSRTMLA